MNMIRKAAGKTLQTASSLLLVIITLTHEFRSAVCEKKLASWRGPNSLVLGDSPMQRQCHGLATVLGNVYVFGGNSGTGGNNLRICHQRLIDPTEIERGGGGGR